MSKKPISNCCKAATSIGGTGDTHYYVCDKCKKPCDMSSEEKKCKHTKMKKGEPNRYITLHYLMCSNCRKAIRRLTGTDMERMAYIGIVPLPKKMIKKYL